MFTGIITDVGRILSLRESEKMRRLRIGCGYDPDSIALGASIACGGPCLTVVSKGGVAGDSWFEVDAAAETLARTTVGRWIKGSRVNLERSLCVGDELGGHIVTGHVDGIAEIVERSEVTADDPAAGWGASVRYEIRAPRSLAAFIAEKGSICLDGTSLTVNSVEGDRFTVLLIPHTLAVTTWTERREGDALNIEIDLMARYAARLADARAAGY